MEKLTGSVFGLSLSDSKALGEAGKAFGIEREEPDSDRPSGYFRVSDKARDEGKGIEGGISV